MMKEGGRGNSSRLVNVITRVLVVGQIALTAALLIAATLQIKSIRNQTKLDYGYDENGVYAARLALMEGAYPTEDSRRAIFHPRRPRAAHQSAVRSRGHDRSFPHDLRAVRSIRSRWPELSDRSRSSARQFRIRLRRLLHDARAEDSGRPRFHDRRLTTRSSRSRS